MKEHVSEDEKEEEKEEKKEEEQKEVQELFPCHQIGSKKISMESITKEIEIESRQLEKIDKSAKNGSEISRF